MTLRVIISFFYNHSSDCKVISSFSLSDISINRPILDEV